MQIFLCSFPPSRLSVTSRMHCYFPCLLLFRIFIFFSFFRRAVTVSCTSARFRYDVSCEFVRMPTHNCIRHALYCCEPPLILSFRFFLSFRSTMLDQHVRDLLPLFTISFFLPLLGVLTILLLTPHKM